MEDNKIISIDEVKEAAATGENAEPVAEDETLVAEEPATEEAQAETPEEEEKNVTKEEIEQMLQTAEMMVNVMRDQWIATMKEYKIDDKIMSKLGEWNDEHRTPMPEDLSDEERAKWDHLNGIDHITEDVVTEIFGPAPRTIDGVTFEDTVKNIKGVAETFLGWMTTLREYRGIHDAYIQLIELEEEQSLTKLKERADEEQDPDLREKYLKSIDLYYDRKFLGFVSEPLGDELRDALLSARSDSKKITYWIQRAKEKLGRLKISPNIIVELSQFEIRFLGPEYKKNNMLLLLYFLRLAAYCNTDRRDDDSRVKVICMVMAMDAFIRRVWNDERIGRLMNNIKAFEDQFLPYIPDPEPDESITPPVSDPVTSTVADEEPVADEEAPVSEPNDEDMPVGEFTTTPPETDESDNYMLDGIADDFESDGDPDE